ncbi:MAG: polysaccharide deacetylase family protein, partial [Bacteroidia bacterium]
MIRLVFSLLLLSSIHQIWAQSLIDTAGAMVRSDTSEQSIYLCFTGHEYYDGFEHVLDILKKHNIQASFFLTGDFVRNHADLVKKIDESGHFVGAHSDKHLLYCDWANRDSLLYTRDSIRQDIRQNLQSLADLGIYPDYFMPPYEWYNQQVVEIARELQQLTVNYSSGTRSNADYTTPEMPNYISSADILNSIVEYERQEGLNGFHLLIHPGTNPLRTDKLYLHLDKLL